MKTKTALPDLPSEILLLALHDLDTVEKIPNVSINMSVWMWQKGPTCEMCLAGAVMSQSLGAGTNLYTEATPDIFKVHTDIDTDFVHHRIKKTIKGFETRGLKLRRKLQFLNDIRNGEYSDAWRELRLKPSQIEELDEIFQYSQDAATLYEAMGYSYDSSTPPSDFSSYDNKELFINHICAVIGTLQSIGL